MTAKELARMRRLETENAELRKVLAHEQMLNQRTLWELVDLRVKVELIASALRGEDGQ